MTCKTVEETCFKASILFSKIADCACVCWRGAVIRFDGSFSETLETAAAEALHKHTAALQAFPKNKAHSQWFRSPHSGMRTHFHALVGPIVWKVWRRCGRKATGDGFVPGSGVDDTLGSTALCTLLCLLLPPLLKLSYQLSTKLSPWFSLFLNLKNVEFMLETTLLCGWCTTSTYLFKSVLIVAGELLTLFLPLNPLAGIE